MTCDALRSPTDAAATWQVALFGKNKATGYEWCIGMLEHETAHKLADEWNGKEGVCSYEVRHA